MGHCFFVYGKRTKEEYWDNVRRCMIPQDAQFRALNYDGVRVNKLEDAVCFATKEDAQEWIDKHNFLDGVKIEIRKKAN